MGYLPNSRSLTKVIFSLSWVFWRSVGISMVLHEKVLPDHGARVFLLLALMFLRQHSQSGLLPASNAGMMILSAELGL